jgi:hypothetical protein
VKWADDQSATVWFFDKSVGEDVRLVNEIQMVDLFEMYKSEMRCHVVVSVFNNEVCDDHEFDSLEPLCVVPPVATHEVNTEVIVPPNTNNKGDGASASKAAMEADAPEPDRVPDMFDNEEEYVGVDDEHIYGQVPHTQPWSNAETTDDDYVPFAAEGDIPFEEEVNDADPQEVQVIHDPENPKIAIGSQFPDIIAFRKAIRHYAVKEGFEFAGLKTDKGRFIAHCAAARCPWRIHASTIHDKKTIEV